MSTASMAALAILALTYVLISLGRIGRFKVRRDFAALAGGIAMVVFGLAAIGSIGSYVRFDLLLLLLGMMVVVVSLELCGFFEVILRRLASLHLSPARLLVALMAVCAALAALMLNDAVVLLFTPIVIGYARRAGLNPVPYLVGLFVSANIGSLATVVGNPQNAYIATVAGIDFLQFSAVMLPLSAVSLVMGIAIVYAAYRNRLTAVGTVPAAQKRTEVDRRRLNVCIGILVCAVVAFAVSGIVGVPLYAIALTAGGLCLLTVSTGARGRCLEVARKVDWSILLFFIGLFVLMAGVVESGLLTDIASVFPGFAEGETPSIAGLSLFSAVLSNLVSNVPSVMLIGEMLPLGDTGLWLALAASSTLAGNATLMGAAANVIVAEEAGKDGVSIDFWRFLPVGLCICAVTLCFSVAVLQLL